MIGNRLKRAREALGLSLRELEAAIQGQVSAQAIQAGRQMARQGQGELLIHGQDGRIRDRDSHGIDPFPPRDRK